MGANSQIARDLIISFAKYSDNHLHLFSRRSDDTTEWLASVGLPGCYPVDDFSKFGYQTFDAIINFVGAGDPAKAVKMGSDIFDVTLKYDGMALNYIFKHTNCRYLFLSSGVAYGSKFDEPANRFTPTIIPINSLTHQEWYGIAKLHAECRHRSHQEVSIFDIRVFNYFSRTQNIAARFLISDILRAIRDKTVLKTNPDYMIRDFLHPSDFYALITSVLSAPSANTSVDCYTRAPIDKTSLLSIMQKNFGLQYEITGNIQSINATGNKPYYFSLNTRAGDFGYKPSLTSLEGVLQETAAIIQGNTIHVSKI